MWIYIEILCFYLYLMAASVYLLIITMKGSWGVSSVDAHHDRFMKDALDYYSTDIDWFAF